MELPGKVKNIAVIASSRATYGYKRKLIGLIQKSSKLELQLIVTGMHLVKKYGYSISEIEADEYPVAAKVDMKMGGDEPFEVAASLGVEIQGLAQAFKTLEPDIALVTGDRAEMFAAAVTAVYMNIPVAHIQAGDVSGHIDGSARHAITKLSHIHFASCSDSAERVKRLGEEPWRVFDVGAPQLDSIIHDKKLSISELKSEIGIDLGKRTLLVIQHPVLVESDQAYEQMKVTMDAISELRLQTIIIYPNSDAGGLEAIRAISEYEALPFIHVYKNINRNVFISLLSHVSALVGNSSCGILEAPCFKLPAINIGNRQRGRMQAGNVINTEVDKNQIKEGILMSLDEEKFRAKLESCVNPYGDGKSSRIILEILEGLEINNRLIDKQITY